MNVIELKIKNKLKEELKPDFLEVKNESNKHNVPINAETHFRVTVVTKKFNKTSILERHKIINEILKNELINDIHALSIRAFATKNWNNSQKNIRSTPNCEN